MSYGDKTGRLDWKDEASWMAISLVSGLLLSFLFLFYDRFPNANVVVVLLICCTGFYLLNVLVLNIQNKENILFQ